MKIIILLRILWTGGAQKIAIEEAKVLKKMGHDVRLIFLREAPSGKYLYDNLKGIDWEIFSRKSPSMFYSAITGHFVPDRKGEGTVDYDLIKQFAKKIISEKGVDYIICHDQFSGIAGYKIKKITGIPYSVFIHERVNGYPEHLILGKLARYMEKKVLIQANAIFAVTEAVSESIKKVYSINSVPDFPGIELESCETLDAREDILLAVSVWDRDRDPTFYLPVLSKTDSFKLIVAGRWRDDVLFKQFNQRIKASGLNNRVTLIENFDDNTLKSLYRKSKFSIRYGIDEYGPGMSNIEALGLCTPIIVYGGLGISDLVSKYGIGFVSKDWNAGEISSYILENKQVENYNAIQGRIRKFSSIYTWDRHANTLLSFKVN
jgi:glycosyltransferase involved in cell wall biosynthesis